MDKYIAGTMRRVGVSVVVLASLSFALLTQKVYHQSPTDRYVHDEYGRVACTPAPMRIVVPWFEDGRMSLIQGVTAAAMDLRPRCRPPPG